MWYDVEPGRTGLMSFESNASRKFERRLCEECKKGGMQNENEIEPPARGQLFDRAIYARSVLQKVGL